MRIRRTDTADNPNQRPHPGLPPDPRRFTAHPRQLTKAGVAGVWAAGRGTDGAR